MVKVYVAVLTYYGAANDEFQVHGVYTDSNKAWQNCLMAEYLRNTLARYVWRDPSKPIPDKSPYEALYKQLLNEEGFVVTDEFKKQWEDVRDAYHKPVGNCCWQASVEEREVR